MDSLRVSSGVKKIEVNDNGEYICIPIGDTAFYEKFAGILRYFNDKQDDINKKTTELSEKYKGVEISRDEDSVSETEVNMIMDASKLYSELCRDVCEKLDDLFGEGCCRKVFTGIEIPSMELIHEFFEAITPYFKKYADERNKKIIQKYNKKRGNK